MYRALNKLSEYISFYISKNVTSYTSIYRTLQNIFIVGTPLFCRGLEPPTKFSKRGGLTGSQLLEGVAGKERERGDFFQGVVAIFT